MEPESSTLSHQLSPPIIGREREQAALGDTLTAMLAGHGGTILVSGEAGIGKTTLVEWLGRQAGANGAIVLWGHAYDLSVTPPYGPWLEIFACYPPPADGLPPLPSFVGNAEELAKVGSQESLFAEMCDFFQAVAARRPLILVLDDLHWADQSSLDFLRFLARQLAGTHILLIATYRSDELNRRHPLSMLLPLLVREARAERLDLRPLDEAGSRALITSRYALADSDRAQLEQYLDARAEGNPFYAGELLRTLEEQRVLVKHADGWRLGDLERLRVPPLLRQVIEGRLARLPDETRALMQVAAVIGQEVPLDLWQKVSGASDETLAAAIGKGQAAYLIEEVRGETSYRFRHALLRETLYEDIIALHRRAWHRRVGEALEGTPNPDPDQVAHHLQQAGDPRAVEWLVKAGERAQRAYVFSTASERFEAALAKLTEQHAPALERAVLLYRIAFLHRYSDMPRAMALADDARQLAAESGDQAVAGRCRFLAGLLQCFDGDLRSGLAAMEQAVTALDSFSAADQARSWSLLNVDGNVPEGEGALVIWLANAGHLQEASARGEQLVAAVREPVHRPGPTASHYSDVLQGLAIAESLLGQPDSALRTFEQARAVYGAVGHHAQVAVLCKAELDLALLPYFPEQLEARTRLAEEGVAAGRRAVGAASGIPIQLWALPLLALEGAGPDAREIAARAYGSPMWAARVHAGWQLARLAACQGDRQVARQVVADLFPEGPATEPGDTILWAILPLQRLAVALALEDHDLPNARAWLEAHDRWLEWSGAVLGQADGTMLWAQYYRALGDRARAFQLAEQALAAAGDPRQPLVLIAVQRFLGQLDSEAGQFAAAEERLQQSLSLADACAAPFERALARLELAQLRATQGQHDAARDLLAEVRACCEPLEARPTLERAAALESRLRSPRAQGLPAGLTAREVEVLRLVAEGLTDAEVAEQLFLSRRTVGQHLRSIYNKLGVNSRLAASRFAIEQHLL